MCRICFDLNRDAMTLTEAYRNLRESVGVTVTPEHASEVRALMRVKVESEAKERMAWESPAGSGEETGV